MKTVTAGSGTILLGRRGENLAVQIQFPVVAEWRRTYGESGTFQLVAQRSNDTVPYNVSISSDDECVYWDVSNADTAYYGKGHCELLYYVSNSVAKSRIWQTMVLESMGAADDDLPDPYQTWYDDILAASARAVEAADTSVTAAAEAQESETDAANSADAAFDSAAAAAVSESNAGRFAELAEEAASRSGFFYVEGREDGHLYYIAADNTPEDFALRDNGEGRLIAVYG